MVVESCKWHQSSRNPTSARNCASCLRGTTVLGRITAGAIVAPGVAERLGEERDFTARYLELLDAGEESSQATDQ